MGRKKSIIKKDPGRAEMNYWDFHRSATERTTVLTRRIKTRDIEIGLERNSLRKTRLLKDKIYDLREIQARYDLLLKKALELKKNVEKLTPSTHGRLILLPETLSSHIKFIGQEIRITEEERKKIIAENN